MTCFLRRVTPLAWAMAVAFSALTIMPSSSWAAAPLPNGASLSKPGTAPALAAPYYTAGPIPANFSKHLASANAGLGFPYNYSGVPSGAFSGSVVSDVWQDPISGALAFSYKFDNLDVPNGPLGDTDILRMTIDDPAHHWAGAYFTITDTGADASGTSTPIGSPQWTTGDPNSIGRDPLFGGLSIQLANSNDGTVLLSSTNNTTTPLNNSSSTVWFATTAKNFRLTNVGLSDGGNTGSAITYAPATGIFVPEPTTLLLTAIGSAFGILALRRRRRSG